MVNFGSAPLAFAKAVDSTLNALKFPANKAVAALCLSTAFVASSNAFLTKPTSSLIVAIDLPN